jgi:hypothetical protein
MATGYKLNDPGVEFRVPVGPTISLLYSGSGAHPYFYPKGTVDSLPRSKVARREADH